MSAQLTHVKVENGMIRLRPGSAYDMLVFQNADGQLIASARLAGYTRAPFRPIAGSPFGVVKETSNDKLFARILMQDPERRYKVITRELSLPIVGGVALESGVLFSLKLSANFPKTRLTLNLLKDEFVVVDDRM